MSDTTPPNLRILKIFEVIADAGRPLTPTEINEQLCWPKQSLHRLCQTLIIEGYLVKQARQLHPTKRLLVLAAGLTQHAAGQTTRHQILQNIARETGETVNFVRPEIKGMFYADRVETDWAFRIQLPIGTNVPFHCTASGKCFLSSLNKRERNGILSSLKLEALTEKTHVTIEALMQELNQIKKQGYALDREEFMEGMIAIAVPIKDKEDRFIGALAFHGPTQRISIENAIARKEILLKASQKLREHLF